MKSNVSLFSFHPDGRKLFRLSAERLKKIHHGPDWAINGAF